jgi:putative endopeptidase
VVANDGLARLRLAEIQGALPMKVPKSLLRIALSSAAFVAFSLAFLMVHAQDTSKETHGIAVANMDSSVKPGDNFYLYANGDWIKRTEIPTDRAAIGVFAKLDAVSSKRTADLIAEAAKASAAAGSNTRKIADLYNSYMVEGGLRPRGRRR